MIPLIEKALNALQHSHPKNRSCSHTVHPDDLAYHKEAIDALILAREFLSRKKTVNERRIESNIGL
jgi:hypothetical protein